MNKEELSEVQGRPWDDVDVSKSALIRHFLSRVKLMTVTALIQDPSQDTLGGLMINFPLASAGSFAGVNWNTMFDAKITHRSLIK